MGMQDTPGDIFLETVPKFSISVLFAGKTLVHRRNWYHKAHIISPSALLEYLSYSDNLESTLSCNTLS